MRRLLTDSALCVGETGDRPVIFLEIAATAATMPLPVKISGVEMGFPSAHPLGDGPSRLSPRLPIAR